MSTLSEISPECLKALADSPVETTIIPSAKDIGGFEVRRALPSKSKQMIGPFIFWDQMGPGEFLTGEGLDVRPHPHIGLSTMTYLFSGEMQHRDSLGTNTVIKPGAVNLMTAGSGITHSERSPEEDRARTSTLFGIQSWLALPKDKEETAPDFAHIPDADIPVIEEGGKHVRIVMGSLYGAKSPVPQSHPTIYADIALEAGASIPIPADIEERGIYTLKGAIEIAGISYPPEQLLSFRPGDEITVKALEPARLILMGGDSMDGPRHIFWNFVSSSRERINQAKNDWLEGNFAKVPGDDKEFIPLPGH